MLQNFFKNKEKKKYKFSILSKEYILFFLFKIKKVIHQSKLAKKLNIYGKKNLENLKNYLKSMSKNKEIIIFNKKIYLSKKLKLFQGIIISNPNGFGFLKIKNEKKDYYLSSNQMKKVIHGDEVLARKKNNNNEKKEACILYIIKQQNDPIVGKFILNKNNSFVIPKDNRFNFKIFINFKQYKYIKNNSIVSVKLINRNYNIKKLYGKIIKILGYKNNINTIINILLYINNFSKDWPKNIDKQNINFSKFVTPKEIKIRKDLRNLPLITIDDDLSHDLDDAVFCKKNKNNSWNLLVAISDVSYYVRENTLLDKEAFNRSTSLYLRSKVIPMLPSILSNNLCSLNPKIDRLCIVCEMIISNKGIIISYKFYEAVINSHAKLSYSKVSQILKNKKIFYKNKNLTNSLINLYSLYKILKKARELRGGIFFDKIESNFIFNSDYTINSIKKKFRTKAHKIIEECMILANISASYFISKYKNPAIYRIHEEPSKENIFILKNILKRFNLKLEGGDNPKSKDFFNIIKLISNRKDKDILYLIILRSMKQAIYDVNNIGHFGLSLKSYTHFTSPIRRYSDLIIHRIIKYNIFIHKKLKFNNLNGAKNYSLEEMLKISQQCSFKERSADIISRNVDDWLKCNFMKKYIGNIFIGFISNITTFGFFVKLDNLIEGLVHTSSLKNNNYFFDVINQIVISNKKIIYSLGDIVKIRIQKICMNKSNIKFSLEK